VRVPSLYDWLTLNITGLRPVRIGGALLAAATLMAGCSSGGFLQAPMPNGQYTIRQVGSLTAAPMTFQVPLPVNGGFSLSISEQNYSAQFQATMVSFTGPTSESCYTVGMDPTGTVAIFSPRQAPPLDGAANAASPCGMPGTDIEGVRITDQKLNSIVVYFEDSL
jgi:hypothetical protein